MNKEYNINDRVHGTYVGSDTLGVGDISQYI